MIVQVIENIDKNGTEWGISFTSNNPEPEDYFKMTDKETAFRLKNIIEKNTIQDNCILYDTCPFELRGSGFCMGSECKEYKSDYYKRLSDAAGKTILEMRSLWNNDIDFEMGYHYKKYQSILKER
jgi:hypothetical protein